MHNLVLNKNGVFTYRKSVNGTSIRVSLQTKDKFEALRVVDKVNYVIELAASDQTNTVRSIVYAALAKFQPTFKQERLCRVQTLLGVSLEQDSSELLPVIVERFIQEKVRAGAWSDKTLVTYKAIYQDLTAFLGDSGIRAIGHKDAQLIKNNLQSLPSSRNKRAMYRNKSIKQILKMDIPANHLMSIKTINIRLGCYSELFKWGMKNGYVEINVFDGLGLKDSRSNRELRSPFTPKDLQVLFASDAVIKATKSWQYWLPLLGLFTGARLNELCQLQHQDIKQVNGIWCISITDKGQEQHIKSASSRRLIPIHNTLTSLGFMGIVDASSSAKTTRLFPELTLRDGRFAHTPSKWFGNLKSRLLVDSDKKSYHSFRHTFVDYLFNNLKLQGNPLVKALVGHTDKEITSGIYGSSFAIEDLNKIVQQIDFTKYGVRFS
jgi:integrase